MNGNTYSEEMGQPPFDWHSFLTKKRRTVKEWRAAEVLSHSWVTCACGNQCALLPRHKGCDQFPEGSPIDAQLFELGFHVGTLGRRRLLGAEVGCLKQKTQADDAWENHFHGVCLSRVN